MKNSNVYLLFLLGTFSLKGFSSGWVDAQYKLEWKHLGRVTATSYQHHCSSLGNGWQGVSEQMIGVTQQQLFSSLHRLVEDSPISKALITHAINPTGRNLVTVWYLAEGVITDRSEAVLKMLDHAEFFLHSELSSGKTKKLMANFIKDFGSFSTHYQNRKVGAYLAFHKNANNSIVYRRDEVTGIRGGLCEIANRWDHYPDCLPFWPVLPAETVESELDGLCYKVM